MDKSPITPSVLAQASSLPLAHAIQTGRLAEPRRNSRRRRAAAEAAWPPAGTTLLRRLLRLFYSTDRPNCLLMLPCIPYPSGHLNPPPTKEKRGHVFEPRHLSPAGLELKMRLAWAMRYAALPPSPAAAGTLGN
ncbi:hypothetical protein E2562_007046 [Oryza meyeriana var. granulata]|uniref:Uncharacterized protein n=1 Tax=Oryza meyeriana var. granulata TaxID=110450 RepID=A0A6G1E8S9_9ORYZ|nr:hypothetical protein E2562_007046 [Oryza meyeriana var. granulata]